MPRTWYSIRASASDNSIAEVSVHDEIGYWGITAKDFIKDLRGLGPVQQIQLSIHSPGGDVFDGWAIYNFLKQHPAKVHVRIEGLAASMASVIAMAGDTIAIPRNAYLMIHNPWGLAIGDAQDMKDTAALLDKLRDGIVNAYEGAIAKRKPGERMTRDQIIAAMDAETWMDGAEAAAAGFADHLLEDVAAAAIAFDSARIKNMPRMKPTQISATSEDEATPVEPAEAPETPATPDPTSPVEQPAPDPGTTGEQPPGQPAGVIARILRAITGTGTAAASPPSELDQLRATLAERDNEITGLNVKLTAANNELLILRPKAQERDDLEAALANKRVLLQEISASHGLTPEETNQLPAPTAGKGSIMEQYLAIEDPAARAAFHKKHRAELRAAPAA